MFNNFSRSFCSIVLSISSEALFKDANGFLISCAKSVEKVSGKDMSILEEKRGHEIDLVNLHDEKQLHFFVFYILRFV